MLGITTKIKRPGKPGASGLLLSHWLKSQIDVNDADGPGVGMSKTKDHLWHTVPDAQPQANFFQLLDWSGPFCHSRLVPDLGIAGLDKLEPLQEQVAQGPHLFFCVLSGLNGGNGRKRRKPSLFYTGPASSPRPGWQHYALGAMHKLWILLTSRSIQQLHSKESKRLQYGITCITWKSFSKFLSLSSDFQSMLLHEPATPLSVYSQKKWNQHTKERPACS